jgi:hypothetical protein
MKLAFIPVAATLVTGAAPASPAGTSDFQKLITTAILDGVSNEPPSTTICVQRELSPPIQASLNYEQTMREPARRAGVRVEESNWVADGDHTAILAAFASARAGTARIAAERQIADLPARFVLFPTANPPPKCKPQGFPPPGTQPSSKRVVVLSFSRPVSAGDYVFIEKSSDCGGLCGSGSLGVFKKQNGKWRQVATRFLWVS